MAFTYDLATDVGKLRMIIPDSNSETHVFEDDELTALLAFEGGVLKRGVALALETIASNEVMVLKVIKLLDITTDGAKVSDALLKRAALLRAQADKAEEDAAIATGTNIDWAEMVVDDFTARERLLRQVYQGAI